HIMPRYVILRHETAQGLHIDFMLEMGGALKTWSLPQPPLHDLEMDAQVLPDHRLAYLDYEGPISGGRGSVARWDRGMYEVEYQSELDLIVQLKGEKLIGKATLAQRGDGKTDWVFSFIP
ncbi:MAG: DNA polymerase ligase N-terminal domain-containing protein, partial [Thermoguttaceae bacterium]